MKHAQRHPTTVWSKDAMPLVPERFQSIYTVLLPSIDVGLILFGVSSLIIGSKLVDSIVLPWFSTLWALLCLVGATVALAALATMHDKLELIGRYAVGFGLVVYIAATALHVFTDSPSSVLTLILTLIRLAATIWRINDLIGEIARKEAANV